MERVFGPGHAVADLLRKLGQFGGEPVEDRAHSICHDALSEVGDQFTRQTAVSGDEFHVFLREPHVEIT
ncbi:hypothetical protein D3C71_1844380 [compost metagenome]